MAENVLVPTRCVGTSTGALCRMKPWKTTGLSASSQAPAWEFGVGSSSFPSHEATTCMDAGEVEQRRSDCREAQMVVI